MGADLFSIGRSGLNVSKKMLETTGHNIANVNTEGYSRQRVTAATSEPIPEGHYVLGTGANVSDVRRSHDDILEKRFIKATSNNAYFEEREVQLGRVENIFNEVSNEGLNKILNKFFNSFRELSNQPEDESVRNIVRENARIVIKDMKRVKETLNFIEDGIDQNMKLAVEDINTLTKHIAKINIEMLSLEAGGGETGDLRDQRDLAVKELSKYFRLQTYANDKGQYTVNVENVGTLLSGGKVSELIASPTLQPGETNKERAPYEIYFKNRPSKSIGIPRNSGKIGAMLETRKVEIKNLKKEVDTIAYNLAKSVNAIHRRGYKNVKFPEDPDGNPVYTPD
ncbi:flagellar hook-associated protein FlgK, partial [Bacteriovoracaceae bacterium]|nr:flagellar hook-associated protein FlgK [Bacteriovoracaceae bacterium]